MATTPKPTEAAIPSTPKASTKKATTSTERNLPGVSQEVINRLTQEVNDMISFAGRNGLTIDTGVNQLIANSTIEDLIKAHNSMCQNVAPATPKSIEFTREVRAQGKDKSIFNKIPLVRNLIVLALFFLIAYVSLGQTAEVNNDSLDKGVLSNQSWSLILNLGFLASISGLGVLFHLLKKVSTSVLKSTLVAEESVNYIAQILLGIIAGLLLSEVLSDYLIKDAGSDTLLSRSLLALIGGFSSDAIFSILEGIINRIKAVFIPSNPQ